MKKNIIISAINDDTGGPFSILEDCLRYLSENMSDKYNIIALVHDKTLLDFKNITYYEFKDSKKSWLRRLYYEYFYFKKFSRSLNPYLWLAIRDITPNVETELLAVYCQCPAPFYNISLKEACRDPKFALFVWLYNFLYGTNIKKNDFVVVQQDCMRNKFKKIFNIKNVIVARPNHDNFDKSCIINQKNVKDGEAFKFFYPVFPRLCKNFEAICEASKILASSGKHNFEAYLTIDGTENRYAKSIYHRYKNVKEIKFIGLQPRGKVYEYYNEADCMIFPSKLETWGMPISEFKNFKKPILLADLEYAHETIGDYDKVRFFNPDDYPKLADLMRGVMENSIVFETAKRRIIDQPFASNWEELFDKML
ncbi:MAG: hypothetical protein A2Y13_08545 [Planctomycetes bacterium GWC2_45_44]|nr:MAG: hypothetical protein A2Y13_08545 [Planctomycetes bacterium GWC2_45_44]